MLLSTAYLGEAERCGHVVVLHKGHVLAQGPPAEVSNLAANRTFLVDPPSGRTARWLQARLLDQPGVVDAVPEGGRVRFVRADEGNEGLTGDGLIGDAAIVPVPPRFEDGFMVLFRRTVPEQAASGSMELGSRKEPRNGELAVEVRDLVRQFGTFTAVDHISFEVHRGEIFGLLGPNGAGKTTTFRMLCGLLASTSGTLRVAGVDLRNARASARQRIGYVAQKFSLYPQLSVTENLDFFASAYSLHGKRRRATGSPGRCSSLSCRHLHAFRAVSCPVATSSDWRWQRLCYMSLRFSFSMSRHRVLIRWLVGNSGSGSLRWPSKG